MSAAETLNFGVVNQRSVQATAAYWNPILAYSGAITDVRLQLRMGKTAPETTAMDIAGEHDFVNTNHLFTPERAGRGYRVILRFDEPHIQGALVVREDSPIQRIEESAGNAVVFPSPVAFVGYRVPVDHLLRSGVRVRAHFAGNQRGAMGQVQSGNAAAAGVNKQVLQNYAQREPLSYRVLWESPPYRGIPIVAHSRLPPARVERVQAVAILRASAARANEQQTGFVLADDADYENSCDFYRDTVVKD
jgi:phosphonate transport system substrate-binding protein